MKKIRFLLCMVVLTALFTTVVKASSERFFSDWSVGEEFPGDTIPGEILSIDMLPNAAPSGETLPDMALPDETSPIEASLRVAEEDAVLPDSTASVLDSGLLWLVNQDNRLDTAFAPSDNAVLNGYTMRTAVSDAYNRMLSAMRAQGVYGMYIQSAYRTYAYQQQIFKNKKTMYLGLGYSEATAMDMTARSIAYPGASEHQTGLALDVTVDGTLNKKFGDTEAGRWIDAHCHEYGFIVRYPEDKTDITRIIYEPWHLRYVGMPHSAFMKEKELCYEEYIDYLKANGMYIYWDTDGSYYLVNYTTNPDTSRFNGVIDVSTDRSGDGACYIITMKKPSPKSGTDNGYLSDSRYGGRIPINW